LTWEFFFVQEWIWCIRHNYWLCTKIYNSILFIEKKNICTAKNGISVVIVLGLDFIFPGYLYNFCALNVPESVRHYLVHWVLIFKNGLLLLVHQKWNSSLCLLTKFQRHEYVDGHNFSCFYPAKRLITEYSHEKKKRENKKKKKVWFAKCEAWIKDTIRHLCRLDHLSDRKIYKVGYVFTTYFEFEANNSISWKLASFTMIKYILILEFAWILEENSCDTIKLVFLLKLSLVIYAWKCLYKKISL